MVSYLTPSNYAVNNIILSALHNIFKRYRHAFRSDELFLEIKLVLSHFTGPFLGLLKATDDLIAITNPNDRATLQQLLTTMLLLSKIYLSLNSQDLPEFFEDSMSEFMIIWLKYLRYENKSVEESVRYNRYECVPLFNFDLCAGRERAFTCGEIESFRMLHCQSVCVEVRRSISAASGVH